MTVRLLPLLALTAVFLGGCVQGGNESRGGLSSLGQRPGGPVILDPKVQEALTNKAEAALAEAIRSNQPPLQALAFETFLLTGQEPPRYDFRALNDPRVRLVALVTAVKQKAPGSAGLCNDSLRDADASVRLAAAFGLVLGGEGAQATALRQGLVSPDTAVRRNAVWLFGLMDNASAVDMLKTKLDDPDAVVVLRTAEALGRLGSADGLEAVRALTEHERHEIRCWATRLLGRIGTKADIPRLQRLAESRFLDVKFAAIGSLSRLGDFQRIELLVDMLDASGKELRRQAAKDPQMADAVGVMKDEDLEAFAGDLRRLAGLELGETGYAPALEPLGGLMDRGDLLQRTVAASAAYRILMESRPWVKRVLADQPTTAPPRKPSPLESLTAPRK